LTFLRGSVQDGGPPSHRCNKSDNARPVRIDPSSRACFRWLRALPRPSVQQARTRNPTPSEE